MAELWPGGPVTLPHELSIDGHRLVIPEIDTPRLLFWLASGQWWGLIPEALDPGQALPLMLRFHDEHDVFDYEHLWDVATLLLGRMSGLSTLDGKVDGYWPARRLAATALHDWALYAAWCASHGQDPVGGQLHQVITRIYAWMRERAGPQRLERVEQDIFAAPPHVAVATADMPVPRHIRDQEAALALAALREVVPGGGERFEQEWTPATRS